MPAGTSLSGRPGLSDVSIRGDGEFGEFIFGPGAPQFLVIDLERVTELESIGTKFAVRERDRGLDSSGVFVSLEGGEFTLLAAPVDNPNSPTFFSVDPTVRCPIQHTTLVAAQVPTAPAPGFSRSTPLDQQRGNVEPVR